MLKKRFLPPQVFGKLLEFQGASREKVKQAKILRKKRLKKRSQWFNKAIQIGRTEGEFLYLLKCFPNSSISNILRETLRITRPSSALQERLTRIARALKKAETSVLEFKIT